MYDTRFQRLPEYIEHVPAKLGQLVEEEYAVVRETDLAGPDRSPAAHETRVADGMMRGPKRTP